MCIANEVCAQTRVLCVCMTHVLNHCICPDAVPGPCDPEDLIDGIIFAATYLGCTHLLSERTPTKSARMQQAQEAWNRVRVRAQNILVEVEEKDITLLHHAVKCQCFLLSKLKTELLTHFYILYSSFVLLVSSFSSAAAALETLARSNNPEVL